MNAFGKDYAAAFVNSHLDALNVDTINMRLLWQDTIVTRDHNVIKTILATAFHDFEKGAETKFQSVSHDVPIFSPL